MELNNLILYVQNLKKTREVTCTNFSDLKKPGIVSYFVGSIRIQNDPNRLELWAAAKIIKDWVLRDRNGPGKGSIAMQRNIPVGMETACLAAERPSVSCVPVLWRGLLASHLKALVKHMAEAFATGGRHWAQDAHCRVSGACFANISLFLISETLSLTPLTLWMYHSFQCDLTH